MNTSREIGRIIARIHDDEIIHGDLTTSNMMLRQADNQIVLIDFGLSYFSTLVEDKAVDLYVLERAFSNTHPNSDAWFAAVLEVYQETSEFGKATLDRYQQVKLRGRKKNCFWIMASLKFYSIEINT